MNVSPLALVNYSNYPTASSSSSIASNFAITSILAQIISHFMNNNSTTNNRIVSAELNHSVCHINLGYAFSIRLDIAQVPDMSDFVFWGSMSFLLCEKETVSFILRFRTLIFSVIKLTLNGL